MRQGAIFSAVFHAILALLIIFGLPLFNDPKPIEDQPIVLEMVTVAEKSNPRPNPTPVEAPRPTPKPPEKVEAKPAPTPPPPAPTPPPQPQVAERAPTPTPKPPEPKPEVKPPEPVPVPKPEVKKEPPKPEPPKQQAQTPPPKRPDPPKKPEPPKEDFIASILKNVAPAKPAPTQPSPQPARPQQATPQPAAPPSLDQQVTRSEIDAVRDQIMQCWSPPSGARDAANLLVTIRADVGPDGMVTRAVITSTGRMGDPFYRAAAESALRAVQNTRCQPLKLPVGKYNTWKTLELNFDPKDMMG